MNSSIPVIAAPAHRYVRTPRAMWMSRVRATPTAIRTSADAPMKLWISM